MSDQTISVTYSQVMRRVMHRNPTGNRYEWIITDGVMVSNTAPVDSMSANGVEFYRRLIKKIEPIPRSHRTPRQVHPRLELQRNQHMQPHTQSVKMHPRAR